MWLLDVSEVTLYVIEFVSSVVVGVLATNFIICFSERSYESKGYAFKSFFHGVNPVL